MTHKPSATALVRARLIVVKIGSAVLTTPQGDLDMAVIQETADTVADLMRAGRRVILVSSGAVAAGRGALGMLGKPATIAEKQALAAVGQSRLMHIYSEAFGRHGIIVGQMLLSRGDMEDRRRYVNARYTLEELLRRRCVPIINENDTVTVDELKFGDNDGLAALVAVKMQADALILLSDVDGLYDSNPKTNPDARLLETVERVTPAMLESVSDTNAGGLAVGSGGMKSKLLAAQAATHEGVCVAIANGKRPGKLNNILSGSFRGTFFPAHPRCHSSREHWILSTRSAASRRIVVDDGARAALLEKKKSLLPAGIARVEGQFRAGDVVEIVDSSGRALGRGVVNYSADELERIKGRRTADIARVLGSKPYDEAIHRDNLAIIRREM
jgi:glutamate 5-kinase